MPPAPRECARAEGAGYTRGIRLFSGFLGRSYPEDFRAAMAGRPELPVLSKNRGQNAKSARSGQRKSDIKTIED